MSKNIFTILIAIVLIILIGCDNITSRRSIRNINRIFMQNPNKYVFYTQEPGSNEIKTLTLFTRNRISIFTDVKEGELSWVEYTYRKNGEDEFCQDATLHIHNVKQINGGEDGGIGKNSIPERNNLIE